MSLFVTQCHLLRGSLHICCCGPSHNPTPHSLQPIMVAERQRIPRACSVEIRNPIRCTKPPVRGILRRTSSYESISRTLSCDQPPAMPRRGRKKNDQRPTMPRRCSSPSTSSSARVSNKLQSRIGIFEANIALNKLSLMSLVNNGPTKPARKPSMDDDEIILMSDHRFRRKVSFQSSVKSNSSGSRSPSRTPSQMTLASAQHLHFFSMVAPEPLGSEEENSESMNLRSILDQALAECPAEQP